MRYVPSLIPGSLPKALRTWLSEELRKLAAAIASIDNLSLTESNAAPEKIADGQVIYADGSNWNPGDGESIYGRINGAWSNLAAQGLDAAADETITGQWTFNHAGGIRIDGAGYGFALDPESTWINFAGYGGTPATLIKFKMGVTYDIGATTTYRSTGAARMSIQALTFGTQFIQTSGRFDFTVPTSGLCYWNGKHTHWLRDGTTLKISDAGDTDYVEMSHDGVDFDFTFTNTTDWNITGLTAIKAASIDAELNGIKATKSVSITANNSSILCEASAPGIELYETDQATDEKRWLVRVTNGNFYITSAKDSGSGSTNNAFSIKRTTNTIDSIDLKATEVTADAVLKIKERAAAVADTAGYGQLWVKNTTPCELWFTDDAGTDTQIV